MNDPAAEKRRWTCTKCGVVLSPGDVGDVCRFCGSSAVAALTAAAEQLRESNAAMERLRTENNKLRRFKNEVIGARVMLSSGIIATPEEQKKSTLYIQAAKASQGLKSSLDKLEEGNER